MIFTEFKIAAAALRRFARVEKSMEDAAKTGFSGDDVERAAPLTYPTTCGLPC